MPLALAAGLRVNYTRAGTGSPLVLLHGWANSSGTLETLVRELADAHDCIVPDLPGFGRSETPKEPEGWDVARHAEWLAQLMDKLKLERADLFGHSHGARIAACLAATRPERVDRLVLCAGAGLRERLPLSVKVRRWRIRLLLRTAHRAAGAGLLGKHGPDRARALSERYASPDYKAAGAMRPTLARVLAEDLQPLLPRIEAPTLLIWGDRDRETPLELGRRSERLIPQARLVVLPGAGHHPFIDQPERVAGEVRAFLQRAGEGAA